MSETVRTRFDGVSRPLQRTDMDDREFFAIMRCGYHCAHRFLAQSGHGQPERLAVIVHDFDVVRTFGNTGIDKSLGIPRFRQRRDVYAVFRSMSAGGSDESSSRAQ